ncbi:MAG: 4'-phosphopantetheinyl transferase superfamily protein, partial [Candidatus Marinimicrobia bacterium]|nr:4'-phosphopantetheinyl transferase superfamily protein [Candidatus Neomarinimicrobiota bacterium]
ASALPSDGDGGPVWPAGYLGSIAHTRAWAVAIAGATDRWRALGIDIEDWRRLQRPGLAQRILTPEELAAWRNLPAERQTRQLALIFSAKEALFKAWHPTLRQPLALRDVALRADPAPRLIWIRPDLPAPPPFQIRWDCGDACCLATACVPAGQTG